MGTPEPEGDTTLEETIEVFEDPGRRFEPLSVSEVADALGCSRGTANRHLTRLAERGRIDSKDVTDDARVWWRPPGETPRAGRREVEHEPFGESLSAVEAGTGPGEPAERIHGGRGLIARIFETVPGSVAVVNRDGEVEWADERARDQPRSAFDEPADDAVDDLTVYGPGGVPVPAGDCPWGRVFETGEAVRDWRGRLETSRGQVRVSVTAVPLGGERPPERIALTVSDVVTVEEQAHRAERRRNELEAEIAEIHERMDDAVFALDDDWRLTYVNEQARPILAAAMGRDRDVEGLEGFHLWEEIPEAVDTPFYDRYHEAMGTQETVTFEAYFEPLETWFDVRAYPSETGLSVYFKDVTERKARERELERYEAIVETVEDGIYVVDQAGYFVEVNEAYESMAGRSREELIGSHVSEVVPKEIAGEAKRLEEELAAGERSRATLEAEITPEDGEAWIGEATFSLMAADSGYERVAVVRDVTERKARERALEESERRYRTLVEHFPNGAVALVDRSLRYLTVGGTPLDIADVTVTELEGRPVGEVLPAELADRLVPRYEAALRGETASFERAVDDRIYQFRIVPVRDDDGEVFAAMGMSQDVTEPKARERQLERQRSQLATLNSLNELVHEISRIVIGSSTREEIERLVCEHLAGSSSYRAAWIGEFDPDEETITPRVATDDEGSLCETAFGAGAAGVETDLAVRAIRTGEVQVARTIDATDDEEFWREHAREQGVRSTAAIPIVHEETSYGVLTVYSERLTAFETDERTVIGRLGWTVGHAINAIDRKRALMGEEVVELEFHVWDAFDGFGASAPAEGTITFDRTIPLGEEQFLQYGTVTPDARGMLDAAVEALPHCQEATVFDDEATEQRFELRLSEPPAVSAIASQGGHIERFAVEDGDITLVVHLPGSADVSRVIELLESEYDGAEMVAKRQMTRADEPSRRLEAALWEQLTEKQRAALEAAYFAGFFAWPRDSSGEDVAESLGVSPPTFHQHVRAGERKLLGALLEG